MHQHSRSIPVALLLVGTLVLAACGGSDTPDAVESSVTDSAVDDLPSAEASSDDAATSELVPDEPVDADDPAVSGEAPDDGSAGGAYSGGVVASSFDGICDVLDEAQVAELFDVEATSVISSVNEGTGVCEFGDGGNVRLTIKRPDIESGADAPDFYQDIVEALTAEGIDVVETNVDGIDRATFLERGGVTITFALDPYYVELSDRNGQDMALTALVTQVAEALR